MDVPENSQATLDAQLGQTLRLIREANGLSQRELARRAGVTNSSISLIEQGQVSPSVSSLGRLLAAIPMSLAHFFACLSALEEQAQFFTADEPPVEHCGWADVQSLPSATALATAPLQRLLVHGDSGASPLFALRGQVIWVVTGTLWVTAGIQRRSLTAGQGVYIPAGQAYRLEREGETVAELLVGQG